MALLLIEFSGKRKRATLNGRASIGRTPSNEVVLDHPAVSRTHAVIEKIGDTFFIIDSHSKNGTLVGNHELKDRQPLKDGDRIAIGPAVLIFRLSEDHPETTGHGATLSETHAGILMACECGAQLWVPKEMIGGRGQCQKCGRTLTLGESNLVSPDANVAATNVNIAASPAVAIANTTAARGVADQPTPLIPADRCVANQSAPLSTSNPQPPTPNSPPPPFPSVLSPKSSVLPSAPCSICQWKIESTDKAHICPSCGLVFHEDCWIENRGCHAYGCDQVNILAENEEESHAEEIGHPPELAPHQHAFPWEYALLAASVLGSLLGLLAFGTTALITLLFSGWYFLKHGRHTRVQILLISMGLSLLGLIAGVIVSCYWWLGMHQR